MQVIIPEIQSFSIYEAPLYPSKTVLLSTGSKSLFAAFKKIFDQLLN
jgi:hypothetical protein